MKKLFFALLLAASLFVPYSAQAGDKDCKTGADCQVHHHGVHRKVVPSNDVVCIFFVQRHPALVTLRIEFEDQEKEPRYYDNGRDIARNFICVGRHWLRDAKFLRLCNDEAHADYLGSDIKKVATKPKLSKDGTACLKGTQACAKEGFKTLQGALPMRQ